MEGSIILGGLWSVLGVLCGSGLLPAGETVEFVNGWFRGNLLAGLVFILLSLAPFRGWVFARGRR